MAMIQCPVIVWWLCSMSNHSFLMRVFWNQLSEAKFEERQAAEPFYSLGLVQRREWGFTVSIQMTRQMETQSSFCPTEFWLVCTQSLFIVSLSQSTQTQTNLALYKSHFCPIKGFQVVKNMHVIFELLRWKYVVKFESHCLFSSHKKKRPNILASLSQRNTLQDFGISTLKDLFPIWTYDITY